PGADPEFADGAGEAPLQRRPRRERHVRLELAQYRADRWRDGCRVSLHAGHEPHLCGRAEARSGLSDREVHLIGHLVGLPVKAHIAHHADDLAAKRLAEVHDEAFTYGVAAGEEPPRQSLVDYQPAPAGRAVRTR